MAPPGGAPQGNPMSARLMSLVQGFREVIGAMAKVPGVDQAKLQQGTQMMREGVKLLAEASAQGGQQVQPPQGM